ncbi:hypothetical protein BDA99DRAFT_565955 [Phascolomyces articulosus]|uniref:histidine kinase n=1 Tax=Phascolomyces articulosus TaxID=60185 RepID=A0AAD5JXB7_9FUNG|nr:hypothetical protein BDA99DRAFT_565955 [Phascolomyces articulosus]
MSISGSSNSITTGSSSHNSIYFENIPYIKGYHFINTTSSLAHYENVEIISGYRIKDKSSVVAKISSNSLLLEREFYIMKKLYQYNDGPSHLVRPLEYLNFPNGLTIAIYSDDGQRYYYLKQNNNAPDLVGYNGYSMYEDLGTFLRFAIKCLSCLEYIHKYNVVHGEIRPGAFQWNGEFDGPVKLWCFGSGSKSLESFLTTENWRKTTNKKGSIEYLQSWLMYMSPEQTGRTTYAPDHRSDIYSLGVVFFTLLTGKSSFDGGPLEIIHAILSRKLPLAHEFQVGVPPILSRIIEKMTNKAPGERYASAYGVRYDLTECLKLLTSQKEKSNTEFIPLFPLAQHDITSVFTLPKIIYGRQDVLQEMIFFIRRSAGLYKSSRLYDRTKNQAIITETNNRAEDTVSDIASQYSEAESCVNNSSGDCSKSTISKSHCSLDGSGNISTSATSRIVFKNTKMSTTTVVGLYGPGGIGKSTLFTEIQPIARQNGYVAISKFDSRNKVPYSALAKLLSHLLQQILSESQDTIQSFYYHFKESLGTQFANVILLADFVSELKRLLQLEESTQNTKSTSNVTNSSVTTPDSKTLDDMEARTRFHNFYIEIFRAITHWRMTTLFLDDLHQADDASLELLESLIVSRIQLLIFISYRDQEVTKKITDSILGNKVADIHLTRVEALDINPLIDFICDTLHRPPEIIIPLAEIIYNRTQGNIFYATQLLQTLERKKHIFYDWSKNEWSFDLDEIDKSTMLNENDTFDAQQLDFIVGRLRELPRAGREILKWASFVGDSFTWDTVKSLVLNDDQDDNDEIDNEGTTMAEDDDNTMIVTPNGDNSDDQKKLVKLDQSECKPLHRKTGPKSTISTSSSNDPISGLQAALQEGYIMSIGVDEFKWRHDRISHAASELANPSTHAKMHLKIAQYMMEVEKGVDIFLVSDHLLKCIDLLQTINDKQRYRQILISAGNKGRTFGAHRMAFEYYMGAVNLGDTEKQWVDDDEYIATLSLYNDTASLSWTVDKYDKTQELLDIIFKYARTSTDRINAYKVQARFCFGTEQHEKGAETLYRCMDELSPDERPRLDTSKEALINMYTEIEELIEKLGEDQLLQLPKCDDPVFIGTLGVMEELLLLSYWDGRRDELYYWGCRIVKLSFTRGLVGSTPLACQCAGLGFVMLLQKHFFGEKLGALGVSLVDKHGTAQEKGFTYCVYTCFLLSWRRHYQEGFHYYKEGMRYALIAGDRLVAGFNSTYACELMFYNGSHTADALRYVGQRYEEIGYSSSAIDPTSSAMCIMRTCKALQGQTYIDTPNVFDGDDGYNDAHFLEESCKYISNPAMIVDWHESFKLVPLVLYEHIDTALEIGYRCFKTFHEHPCHRHTRMMLFYFSLALIEKCRQDPSQKEEYFAQVRANQEYLHEYAVNSPINFAMYWTLIEAELAGFNGSPPDILQASRLYEDALSQAREGKWYLELCVIHEYTGAFYLRNGFRNIAYCFIKKSIDMYMGHGSYGKARHVSTKYSELLGDLNDIKAEPREIGVQTDTLPYYGTQTPPNGEWSNDTVQKNSKNNSSSPTTTVNNNDPYTSESMPPVTTEQTLQCLDIVDMASILKSSHVISSEVRFDSLLVSMLDIIFENSGADCGAIILKEENYGVCAYGCQNEPVVTYDPPKPLNDADELISSSIVNHTIHTDENIFIYNVKKDTRFAVGTWFERTGEKSVISMPITHKSRTVGCLLIEGAVGVFTQRHVMVLSLLCQQMGISTINASLFKSVQHATMANIRMIEMQKQALEEARRSKEAAIRATRLREMFLANMSHEIRTPFAGFYGMISLLAGTELDSEQHDLVKTAKESCEMLLRLIDDLLNFSKLQAGKVSLDFSEVVIEDIIVDVVEMLIAMAIQKRLNITYDLAPDVPQVVLADANRLRQIIINLLGNAIKFTHKGEIKIRCSVQKDITDTKQNDGTKDTVSEKRMSLLFEVIDSGIGINKEQRKSLFVPFSQVDGSTTRKYGGTGLGLSICLQLVELMSGKIGVNSIPLEGSTFFFNIKTTIPESIEQSKSRRKVLLDDLSHQVRGVRILVGDQYLSTVALVKRLLPSAIVDGACSIKELIKRNVSDYQVIIVGLYLPVDMDSDAIINQFKLWLKQARCILILHYPTGAIGEMLIDSNNWNKNKRLKTEVSSFNDNERESANDSKTCNKDQQQQDIVTLVETLGIDNDPYDKIELNHRNSPNNNKENEENRVVARIAVPLRRKTLLRTIVGMIQPVTTPALSIATPTVTTPRQISSPLQRPPMASRKSSDSKKARDPNEVLITPEERERFSKMHILIAEDNPVAQKLLYKQLTTRFGFQVTCANDGLEAFEAWTTHPRNYFTMAIFDHHMPKCDGVEATKRIRKIEAEEKRNKPLPISALTADIQDSARELCMNAGMTEYLTKPTNHKILAEILRRYCCGKPTTNVLL